MASNYPFKLVTRAVVEAAGDSSHRL